jgi:[protein-PII] uridylyltransferase
MTAPINVPAQPFIDALEGCADSITQCKAQLQAHQQLLDDAFSKGANTRDLIEARAQFIDQFLQKIWESFDWDAKQAFCMVSVGGYGRGELHPHSDIDLLLILKKTPNPHNKNVIERFITFLWDCGLDLGHSVRTLKDSAHFAEQDITVLTNLLESRVLFGDTGLYEKVIHQIDVQHMWPSDAFFLAKWEEQRDRHRRIDNSEYNLEPNLKMSPGGLRDIQTIIWIAKRHLGEGDISKLVERGFLTDIESEGFAEGINFLWKARYALHMVSGRHEDRLLFEYQVKIAELFGYADDGANLAVEKFMQAYYRQVSLLAELNDVIMQHFDQDIVHRDDDIEIIALNERFCVRDGYIDVVDEAVFANNLSALMEIFLLMAEHSYIRGVRASTIRLMRTYRDQIDDDFRNDPKVIDLFLALLRSEQNVPLQLKRMAQYGILSKYLPAFGAITGKMQFDLFHIYTVDNHTLEVVQNIYKFAHQGSEFDYVLAAKIINGRIKIDVLYLAALFHDIAKGRGGDHSELGGNDAREFCLRHGIHPLEINLIVWLIESHLRMSSASQKQDINDPDVIRQFAESVSDSERLEYLYILTIADINGTNPELWNAWRASLLRQLYTGTARALRRGLENPVDKQAIITNKQSQVLEKLRDTGIDTNVLQSQFKARADEFFLRESADDIAQLTQAVIAHGDSNEPLVIIKPSQEFDAAEVMQITIYCKLRENRFSFITLALEQLNLTINDARLMIAGGGQVLDTYYVLDADNVPIKDDVDRIEKIRQKLVQVLESSDERWAETSREASRRMRSFSWPSQTEFSNDYAPGFSVLEMVAPDRPGLLTVVGQVFFKHELRLHNAKISTLGERVEDVFFLTDRQDRIIDDADKIDAIQRDLREALDDNTNQ